MATKLNGRGRKPVLSKPRKSYYVKKADREKAQAAQKTFAFGPEVSGEEMEYLMQKGVISRPRVPVDPETASLADLLPRQLAALLVETDMSVLREAFCIAARMKGRGMSSIDFDYSWFGAALPMERLELQAGVLSEMRTIDLLRILALRGGAAGQLGKAGILVEQKSQDYNQTGGAARDALTANRDVYFPFGLKSYVHMIHTKSQRLISLALKDDPSNFEGPRDTALDIINYGSFLAEWLEREEASLDKAVGDLDKEIPV
jgi:hypothetical protein